MSLSRIPFVTLCTAILLVSCQSAAPPFECTDAIGCVEVAPGGSIKIGVLQVLSGEQKQYGQDNLRSIELSVDEWDAEVLGHPIELLVEDSLCSQEGGATAAAKVAADPHLVGIIGPTCSGAATGAMKIVAEAGLAMISGSSSAPSLTSVAGESGLEWRPGFLRTSQNDALSGRAAATFAVQHLGLAKAATINDGDPYTQGLTDTFEQVFVELGGQIVLTAGVNKGDSNMQPVLTAVARSGTELLFFPVFQPEGDYIVTQIREVEGLETVTLMSAEGLYQDSFIEAVGETGVGMYLVIPTTPEGPAHDTLVARFVAKYGQVPASVYYAHTYDAAHVLLNAIQEVATRETNTEGTLHIGRQALRDALYATSGYQGLTGSLTCDEYGDCGVARFQVVRLEDPEGGLDDLASNVVFTYTPGQ